MMIKRRIQIQETNIRLRTDIEAFKLVDFILKQRGELKNYISKDRLFLTSFEPLKIEDAAPIVKIMARAAAIAKVGPMAAVAGTISQLCLNFLLKQGAEYVIVDNGGDVALKTNIDVVMGLYAGETSLSGKIGFKIKHDKTPLGICTSSGTVGHSISFGRADAVTVFASEASIADALATSIANRALGDEDEEAVKNCLEMADDFRKHFQGVLVVVGEAAGTVGKIPSLVETDKKVVLGDLFDVY